MARINDIYLHGTVDLTATVESTNGVAALRLKADQITIVFFMPIERAEMLASAITNADERWLDSIERDAPAGDPNAEHRLRLHEVL